MENQNKSFEDDLKAFLLKESKLGMLYGVKDTEGKYRTVIDVDTVIDIFKEIVLINNPDVKFD